MSSTRFLEVVRQTVAVSLAVLIVAFSARSAQAWLWTHTGDLVATDVPHDYMADVAAFPDGSVAVAGVEENYWGATFVAYELDWVIARIRRDGTTQWVVQLASPKDSTYEFPNRIAVDPAGNVIVGGRMYDENLRCGPNGIPCSTSLDCAAEPNQGCAEAGYRTFIAKLNGETGATVWAGFFATPAWFTSGPINDFATDSAGNILVAFVSTSGQFRVVKFDGDDPSQTLWTYTEPSASGESTNVVLDGAGDALVAGTLNPGTTPQAFVAKLDGDTGTEVWRNDTLPAMGISGNSSNELLVLADGDAVVAARAPGSPPSALIARLDASDGSVVWTRPLPVFEMTSSTSDYSTHVYVAGNSAAGFAMTAVDLATGDVSWSNSYGSGSAYDVEVAGDGKPVAVGTIQGSNGFDLVAATAADGTQAWRTTVPSPLGGEGLCVARTSDGNIVGGGSLLYPSGYPPPYGPYDKFSVAVRVLASNGTQCGDGVLDENEGCDDGNATDGDCCSSTCQYDAPGTACDDGLACSTASVCNGSGVCNASAGNCCGDGTVQTALGENCDAAVSCCVSCQVNYGASCTYGFHPACNPGVCYHFGSCVDGPSVCSCCSVHSGFGCSNSTCQQCVTEVSSSCASNWTAFCVAVANGTCAPSCNCATPTTTTTTPTTTAPSTSTTTTTLASLCPATPGTGCLVPGVATVLVRDGDDAQDQIKWKWTKGPHVIALDLGDPRTIATYALCIYDSTGGVDSLVASLAIAPGPNWMVRPQGDYNYKDKTGSQSGVIKGQLRIGGAGKSKAQIQAKGVDIPTPAPISMTEFFDQDGRVTFQLRNNQTSTCWTTEFTSAIKNLGTQYKAKYKSP